MPCAGASRSSQPTPRGHLSQHLAQVSWRYVHETCFTDRSINSGCIVLLIAYIANIVILAPVALGTMISSNGAAAVVQFKFPVDSPFRTLVGCLWTAILFCSAVGLFLPRQMVGILLLQIVYKSLFLGLVIFPLWRAQGLKAVPSGITVSFVLIVLIWPLILWAEFPWS